LWIVAAVIVIGGIWWWMSSTGSAPSAAPQANNTQPAGQGTAATNPAPAATVSDNSNAALNQDLGNIDAQMSGMSSDSASINQGLNDQPVQQ